MGRDELLAEVAKREVRVGERVGSTDEVVAHALLSTFQVPDPVHQQRGFSVAWPTGDERVAAGAALDEGVKLRKLGVATAEEPMAIEKRDEPALEDSGDGLRAGRRWVDVIDRPDLLDGLDTDLPTGSNVGEDDGRRRSTGRGWRLDSYRI
jgi:hypothetical protein